jgi:succinate dehydrogenase / fumarate reductase cytochrome b subunit
MGEGGRSVDEALIRKVHSLSGVLPLGLFLLYHAWQQSPVRHGRDPMLVRLDETTHGLAALLVGVALPLLVHGTCGLWLARRGARDSEAAQVGYRSHAFRRFQAMTGVLTALFLVLHMGGVWRPWLAAGRAFAVYGVMLDHTGSLPGAAAYVVGISATCVHWGQGFSAFLLRWWPRCSPRFARTVGALSGGALWLTFLNELAVYATGAALM